MSPDVPVVACGKGAPRTSRALHCAWLDRDRDDTEEGGASVLVFGCAKCPIAAAAWGWRSDGMI